MKRMKTFAEAIRETLDYSLQEDPAVYVMGLGVPDPKGIFGTTSGLQEKYGEERVFDMPTSENGMTGVAIGTALMGMRPVMTHQRLDFMLLALDQIVNNAAKWHYMFDGQMTVPLVIRGIIGMGWGQGPQHSQNLHALFAQFPGLKVVMPATARDAKGLLRASIRDLIAVIFIDNSWLHGLIDDVPEEAYEIPIGRARIAVEGSDVTIVSSGYPVAEAVKAARTLQGEKISAEVIDLRTIRPLDMDTILRSVQKTGHLIVVDHGWKTLGFAGEIMASVVEEGFDALKKAPVRITFPDCYTPTAQALTRNYYPSECDIIFHAKKLLGQHPSLIRLMEEKQKRLSDVPDKNFTGPF